MYHMSIKSMSEQMTQLDSQIRCSSSHDHVSEGTGNRHETHMTVHDPLSSPLLITMNTEADAELNVFPEPVNFVRPMMIPPRPTSLSHRGGCQYHGNPHYLLSSISLYQPLSLAKSTIGYCPSSPSRITRVICFLLEWSGYHTTTTFNLSNLDLNNILGQCGLP